MTERYTPEWGPEPAHIAEWKRNRPTTVTIHPANTEAGRNQVEAMAEALFRDEHHRYEPLDNWHDTTERAREVWRHKVRVALDALKEESNG